MGTKNYDSATDMITFSRASKGTALRKVSYGNELVTNGTFDDASAWSSGATSPATVTKSGGKLTLYSPAGESAYAQQDVLTVGKLYQITFDLVHRSGTLKVQLGSGAAGNKHVKTFNLSGSHTVNLLAGGSDGLVYFARQGSCDVDIDNVSVKEVTFDQADGTLELFNYPEDVPRIECDAAGAVKGLLIEEARTNLVTYSEDFTNAAWVDSTPVIVTPNQAVSPDGTQNADSVELVSNGDYTYQLSAVSASTQYSFSWYIKAGTATVHVYGFYDQSNAAWVDQTKYTITDGESVGNGWYRVTKTVTTPVGCTSLRVYPLRTNDSVGYDPDTIGTSILYGAQLELGSFASSYIPTSGNAATRAADIASIPTSAFGYNSEGGTVVVDFNMSFDGTNYPRACEIGSTINNQDRINVFGYAPTAIIGTGLFTAGVGQGGGTLSTGNTVPTGPIKAAFAWRENDLASVQDGGTVIANNTATITGGNPRTVLALGGAATFSGDYLNGHIKSIQYYPRRLTNAQLQELTT